MKKQNVLLVALFLSLASFTTYPHSGCGSCCSPCYDTRCGSSRSYDTCCSPCSDSCCDSSCCSNCCCGCTEDKAFTPNKTFFGQLTYSNKRLCIYKKTKGKRKYKTKVLTMSNVVDFRFSKCSRYLFTERLASRYSCATTFSVYNLYAKKRVLNAPKNTIFDYDYCNTSSDVNILHAGYKANFKIHFSKSSNLTIKITPNDHPCSFGTYDTEEELVDAFNKIDKQLKKAKTHSFANAWKAVLDESNKNLIIYLRTGRLKIYNFNSGPQAKLLYEFV